MTIEVLLTEAEIADEFAESIEARDIPEKFFYWSPASVKAWQTLSARSEEQLQATWETLAAKAPDLTKQFGKGMPVISFGAGDGSRDRLLLKSLANAGRNVKYFPVDASQTLLEMACARAEQDDCEVLGIKADISSPMHLLLAADVSEAPRLFLMVGNTLAGFDPLEQAVNVAKCMHKGDILITDATIHGGSPLTPSEEQRQFAFAPLVAAGLTTDDGGLEYAEKPDDRLDGLFILTRRFHTLRDLRLIAAGRDILVARGERILLNFRYLFSLEAIRWLLNVHAGLRIVGEIPGAHGHFMTFVCIKP
ncbi:MAG TPA: L-histidine N(alpha)-methyltransferase [Bryobacteraceae bacterium]|nr:L-histidine N(alpha)-methyltransferase [Bryobacteraceae bacterium]